VSPGAGLGDVTRQLYVIVGRGSALYLPMEHRNMPEKKQYNQTLVSCTTDQLTLG